MKNIKKILLTVMIGIFIVSSVGCKMVAKTDAAIQKSAVAKVDGEKITRAELDIRMAPIKASMVQSYGEDWQKDEQAKTSYIEQCKETRSTMIDEVLIMQKAKKANALPKDADVNVEFEKKYAENVTQMGDETKLVEYLQMYGYTKDTYKAYLKEQIRISKAIELLLKDVTVDEAEIKKEYEENKTNKYSTEPNKMHIYHIIVATEAEALKVVDRLNKGEDFAKVAKEVSTDGTKQSGGDLGEYYLDKSLNEGSLDETFVKAAVALENGKYSAPVKTTYGWHVIKVTDKTNFPAKAYDAVKETIKTDLIAAKKSTKLQEDLTKWKTDLGKKIKTYDDDLV